MTMAKDVLYKIILAIMWILSRNIWLWRFSVLFLILPFIFIGMTVVLFGEGVWEALKDTYKGVDEFYQDMIPLNVVFSKESFDDMREDLKNEW